MITDFSCSFVQNVLCPHHAQDWLGPETQRWQNRLDICPRGTSGGGVRWQTHKLVKYCYKKTSGSDQHDEDNKQGLRT